MNRSVTTLFLLVASGVLIGGCATKDAPAPRYPSAEVDAGGHTLRTHNVVMILDASSSMGEIDGEWQKFAVARAATRSIVESIPAGAGINAALRTFGRDASTSVSAYGMDAFHRGTFLDALAEVTGPGGTNPLGGAIEDGGGDLGQREGHHALIIVSDGRNMGADPSKAAAALKKTYGDRLCIYPVLVGDDADGRVLMASLAEIGGCGGVVAAESLADGQTLASFISGIFLGDGVPDAHDEVPETLRGVKVDKDGFPLDSDGDGVPDHLDKCPDTPRGVKVDPDGCPFTVLDAKATTWTFNDINFAVGKADIRGESYPILDRIAAALAANPRLKVVVEGHTDNSGSRDLNIDLSQRRAQAVLDYLVGKGIAENRLSAKGYGPDRPIADNATAVGKAQNRRVQFTKVD